MKSFLLGESRIDYIGLAAKVNDFPKNSTELWDGRRVSNNGNHM